MRDKTKKMTSIEIFEELEHITNFMPSPLYWLDNNGIVLGFNDAMGNIHGQVEGVRSKVIGKRHEDFYPEHVTKILNDNNRQVVETGKTIEFEEEAINVLNGQNLYYTSIRAPWRDDEGNIIGIIGTSIDITDKKDKERLTLENQRLKFENELNMQRLIIEEKEKLITLAHKVAHDISSPLSALTMMMSMCNELQENKRTVIKKAAESILDIANNLLNTYREDDQLTTADHEQRQPVLISDLITQLLSEKKVQYNNHTVRFDLYITDEAQFAFVDTYASQFRRSLSNLINNAVDALQAEENGLVAVQLTADNNSVRVTLEDNGQGMPANLIEKILQRHHFTDGKQNGHGLGLQQVWDTLDNSHGKMHVQSHPGQGTRFQLTFPRSEAPDWIAQTIHLSTNSIILILDDEPSIHGAWDARFATYLRQYPDLTVHHVKQGQEALDFLNKLTPDDKQRVVLLSDYELLRQNKNGLQIIEASQVENTTLVTSYYSKQSIKDKAIELGVKILPKQMASVISIEINNTCHMGI